MVSYKRYEVLLPLRYNDGTPVEPEKFVETRRELFERFRGLTADFVPLTGYWIDPTDTVVEDQLVRLVVDVTDTPDIRDFFVQWKERLRERFSQSEIWITGIPVDII